MGRGLGDLINFILEQTDALPAQEPRVEYWNNPQDPIQKHANHRFQATQNRALYPWAVFEYTNTGILYLRTDVNTSVKAFTTSNMTPYFYPKGYAIPKDVSRHGIYPLITNNHMVPINDDIQYVGALRRRYNSVYTSKVYTRSLVIPLADPVSYLNRYVDTRLNVSFTDPRTTTDKIGWQFVATNYSYQTGVYNPTRVMNFVAGPEAGEIVAKNVRCTNLYVKPRLATGLSTVQVNGSISCNSLIVGGNSNIEDRVDLMGAMSYLQASTMFKALITIAGDVRVRATLDHNGLTDQWKHLCVSGIVFTIVITEETWDPYSSTFVPVSSTYHSSSRVMSERSSSSGIYFYSQFSDVYSQIPYDLVRDPSRFINITISPTLYVHVNNADTPHTFLPNRTTYLNNPTGTRIEVACPPLSVANNNWSGDIRL